MQKVFPDMEIEISEVYVFAWIEHEPTHFDVKWWNEDYKGPTPKESSVVEEGINRDDAIEVLKDWDGYFIGHSSDDVVKALNLAIKALEHPEKNVVAVVPCGDAISREEVLKLMKDNWHSHNGDWAMQESLDDIRALPSVLPRAKGHNTLWVRSDNPRAIHVYEKCGFKRGKTEMFEMEIAD